MPPRIHVTNDTESEPINRREVGLKNDGIGSASREPRSKLQSIGVHARISGQNHASLGVVDPHVAAAGLDSRLAVCDAHLSSLLTHQAGGLRRCPP